MTNRRARKRVFYAACPVVLLALLLCAFLVCFHGDICSHSATSQITVPDDYTTIQKAIDSSKGKTLIWVSPGRYIENIDFLGKPVYLKSVAGPETTTIDGNHSGTVVRFVEGEGPDSGIEGFTIENGRAELEENSPSKTGGGGIYCYGSGPMITKNIIRNNRAENGGGILCHDCLDKKPLIISNLIENNDAVKGGGIRCSNASGFIVNNVIIRNRATRLGGGLYWRESSSPLMVNNTFMNNSAGEFGGGLFGSNRVQLKSPVILSNSILWGNRAPHGSQIALNLPGTKVTAASSVVEHGRDGVFFKADNIELNYLSDNISTDPQIDLDTSSLLDGSPCIDKGNNDCITGTDIATDFNGNDRIVDGNDDGNSEVDIGAYEWYSSKSQEEDIVEQKALAGREQKEAW